VARLRQIERVGLPKGDLVKQTNMSSILQLMQDMNNMMIDYEQKGISSSSSLGASSSSLAHFRNANEKTFHPKAIMTHTWCKFCEENHDENTCEVKINARDKIFGKRPDTMITILDWDKSEDVMVFNTRNKSYTAKRNFNLPLTSSAPSSSSPNDDTQTVRTSSDKGVSSPLPSSQYNILNQLDNIKVDDALLDMVVFPEQ
jgi:hypothetical protein